MCRGLGTSMGPAMGPAGSAERVGIIAKRVTGCFSVTAFAEVQPGYAPYDGSPLACSRSMKRDRPRPRSCHLI